MPEKDLTETNFLTFRRNSITLTGDVNVNPTFLSQCVIELYRGANTNNAKLAQKQQLISKFFIFIVKVSNTTEVCIFSLVLLIYFLELFP